jgi:hypothetical protein
MQCESTMVTVAFPGIVLRSSTCIGVDSLARGGGFDAAVLGASMVGGLDRHRRLATETNLVVWWSLGVSGLHGGGL